MIELSFAHDQRALETGDGTWFDHSSNLRALQQEDVDPRHSRHAKEIAQGKYAFDEYFTTSWLLEVVMHMTLCE